MNEFTARATINPRSASATVACSDHRVLRPVRERHHVGRAERRRVREAEVQVVEEDRPPARRRELGAHVLREREVDRGRVDGARDRAAAVHQPVEQSRTRGCSRARRPRPWRAARSAIVRHAGPLDQVVDEERRRPQGSRRRTGATSVRATRRTQGVRLARLPGAPTSSSTTRIASSAGTSYVTRTSCLARQPDAEGDVRRHEEVERYGRWPAGLSDVCFRPAESS